MYLKFFLFLFLIFCNYFKLALEYQILHGKRVFYIRRVQWKVYNFLNLFLDLKNRSKNIIAPSNNSLWLSLSWFQGALIKQTYWFHLLFIWNSYDLFIISCFIWNLINCLSVVFKRLEQMNIRLFYAFL